MGEILEQRERQRAQLLGLARAYVQQLAARVPVVAAAVVGSVARGDFNVWSDVDVVVVSEGLPARAPDRAAVLAADAPPGVQPVGFTPDEFRRAWERRNPLARSVAGEGVVLLGEAFFAEVARKCDLVDSQALGCGLLLNHVMCGSPPRTARRTPSVLPGPNQSRPE